MPRIDDEDFPGQLDEVRRSDIVEKALDAVHKVICDGSSGSVEETDYLYAEVARKLGESVWMSIYSRLVRHDLNQRMEARKNEVSS